MNKNISSIIEGLEAEREAIRADAEHRMGVLQDAIDQLSGTAKPRPAETAGSAPTPPQKNERGPKVADLCRKVIAGYPADKVFDKREVRDAAIALSPDHTDKIKMGIYPAMNQLKDNEEIKLVPGGYQKTEKLQGA